MKRVQYTRVGCPAWPDNYNKGNIVEWRVGYDKTGVPARANNRCGADVEGWQVKSPKASMGVEEESTGFIFGFADDDCYYEMSKAEFEGFLQQFSYVDHDSKTGKAKIRIKNDTKTMRAWFEERA